MSDLDFAIVIAGAGVLTAVVGLILVRFAQSLALPPNRDFAEERWRATGLIFTIGGFLAVIFAAVVVYRTRTF